MERDNKTHTLAQLGLGPDGGVSVWKFLLNKDPAWFSMVLAQVAFPAGGVYKQEQTCSAWVWSAWCNLCMESQIKMFHIVQIMLWQFQASSQLGVALSPRIKTWNP